MTTNTTRLITLTAALILHIAAFSQITMDFEDFELQTGDALNGSDLSGGFMTGNIFLPNDYNENYASWQGWAISAHTDTLTPGFTNDLSAIAGEGVNASTSYAVSFTFGENRFLVAPAGNQAIFSGMYVTNNTFAYLSMRDGDAFAKKFGGETGDDPDWFKLTIKAYFNGELTTDSIDFYLADYRFEDNTQDYIVDDWTWVDLTPLERADSLSFVLSSTDNGQFGMNTPSYFCIDDVTIQDITVGTEDPNPELEFALYPIPASSELHMALSSEISQSVSIINAQGQIISSVIPTAKRMTYDISQLAPGSYFVRATNDEGYYVKSFVKN